MLTPEQIQANKERFIDLIKGINFEGADTEGLIKWLESSDFFTAPASTQFHACYEGGLCQHSLNVYDNLSKLVATYTPNKYPEESIRIVALLHDLAKVNFYTKEFKNKKIYSESGKKSDEMGKFDWVSVPGYAVKDAGDRFIAGTHGQNSVILINRFLPMTVEETSAVLWHMGCLDMGSMDKEISNVFNKYSLAVLLHTADLIATYIDEQILPTVQ